MFLVTECFGYTEVFFMLLNDDIDWWYVAIAVILLTPAIVGAAFLAHRRINGHN